MSVQKIQVYNNTVLSANAYVGGLIKITCKVVIVLVFFLMRGWGTFLARFRSRCKIIQKIEPKSAAVQILRSSCNTYSYINYRWRRLGTWYRTAVIDILLLLNITFPAKYIFPFLLCALLCFPYLNYFRLLREQATEKCAKAEQLGQDNAHTSDSRGAANDPAHRLFKAGLLIPTN